ncbi:hypothetical protein CUJ84_pRLN1000520 (plasmid) [Rhizobium leguminosarum]|uniref:Uncharacterized protein n=1 Tax=Rhizobium leguminosarum TaxID=384 RepID=A0A2K9ZD69_RHILE|nr:hypothetical protein CUJ84_pRLN1000520 [Rhizobium leguminosarum]
MSDVADGIDTLFAEITELAPLCRFRDCTHAHERDARFMQLSQAEPWSPIAWSAGGTCLPKTATEHRS